MADFGNAYQQGPFAINELMTLIASYLSPEDLASFRLICQAANNKISSVTILQPFYNQLYQIDKTLPAQMDPSNAFLSFKHAFEKIRTRQNEEMVCFESRGITFPSIPAETIEALQQRDAILNQINIDKINQAVIEQPGLELNLSYANITRFIIPGDKKDYFALLQKLDCKMNRLTSLSLEGCTALQRLNCSYNELTNFKVDGCAALIELDCSNNQLTTLSLERRTALIKLDCAKNHLTTLKVDGCTALQHLDCYMNKLTILNLKECAALQLINIRMFENKALVNLNLQGASALAQYRLGQIEEKLLVEQLIYAGSSERENIIQRLGERYNTENCLKYSCIHAASLSSADEPWEDLKSFLPMMQAIREDFMDEDRASKHKREREDIEKNEGPESKKRKPNSP